MTENKTSIGSKSLQKVFDNILKFRTARINLRRARARSKWKRPVVLRADGSPMNRREIRMAFIADSQREGVRIATGRRRLHVPAEWRRLVGGLHS